MTKDIKEAAQEYIDYVESCYTSSSPVKHSKEYQELKAALKPSKEEVADWLNDISYDHHMDIDYMDSAIEYLRER